MRSQEEGKGTAVNRFMLTWKGCCQHEGYAPPGSWGTSPGLQTAIRLVILGFWSSNWCPLTGAHPRNILLGVGRGFQGSIHLSFFQRSGLFGQPSELGHCEGFPQLSSRRERNWWTSEDQAPSIICLPLGQRRDGVHFESDFAVI